MPDDSARSTGEAELESWVREELELGAEATVRISERAGTDPRCSPIVTEVAIETPGEAPWSIHIERSLAEVQRIDLVAAMAFGGGH